MSTSRFFNLTKHQGSQNLIQDLVDERIKLRGIDVKYVPVQFVDDRPLNEHDHTYQNSFELEVFVDDYSGFNTYSWGKMESFRYNDQLTLTISRRRFKEEVGNGLGSPDAIPQEGDLIYFPLGDKMFRVNNIMDDEDFMQFGAFYTYRVVCSLASYNGEEVNTGDPEVDDISNMLVELEDRITHDGVEKPVHETTNVSNEYEKRQELVDLLIKPGSKIDFGD